MRAAPFPVTSTPTLVVSRGTKIYPVSGTLNYEILKRLDR
jgi:hypothetical protein